MIINILCWIATLLIAFLAGKAVSKLKLPAILGWLITGMILGPNAVRLLPRDVLDTSWYKTIIMWMQCSFGLMLGTELVWKRIKNYGKALMVTTLTQSLGTFVLVSLVFGIVFQCMAFRFIWVLLSVGLLWQPHRHRLYPSSASFTQRGLSQIHCFLWLYWMILWELRYFLR